MIFFNYKNSLLETLHNKRMLQIKRHNELIALKNEEYKLKQKVPKLKKRTSSKMFLIMIFVNCSAIEIFSMWITYKSLELVGVVDLSAVIALIGAVIGESLSYLIYAHKATKENMKGGITYDIAMKQQNSDALNNDVENNDANVDYIYLEENNSCG